MSNTSGVVDPELVAMMDSVFAARGEAAPSGFDGTLWKELDQLGLVRLTGPEPHGSGADWHTASALLAAAAGAGVPVPLVEHDLLAGWLLDVAGLPCDNRPRSAFLMRGSGASPELVPWARSAEFLVALRHDGRSWGVAEVPVADARLEPVENIAGEPRDLVVIDPDTVRWTAVPDSTATVFILRGALARVLQMCGAMERIVGLCLEHASTRHQFGRPLAKFQALQRLIATAATETALARAAADAAVARVEQEGWESPVTPFSVAVAKSCAGHAASIVVRNAHQIHGAIGTTAEHSLHRYTNPVLLWRSEFGSIKRWDELITQTCIADPAAKVWEIVTSGTEVPNLLDAILRDE
ncbi:acyl-CoA dehydrogenase family protein [Mycolicibacterium thermoresistibile]